MIETLQVISESDTRPPHLFMYSSSFDPPNNNKKKKKQTRKEKNNLLANDFLPFRFVYKTLKNSFYVIAELKEWDGKRCKKQSVFFFRDIEVFINSLSMDICKSIVEQHTMNINCRFLWAVLDMESLHFPRAPRASL